MRQRCRCGLYYEAGEWSICPACGGSLKSAKEVQAEMEAELAQLFKDHNG